MGKRTRACEECHRLKIKCDAGTQSSADDDSSNTSNNSSGSRKACERCIRNNIGCVPAAPRLQRDRISELDAEVAELKREVFLLRSSSINGIRSNSSSAGTTRSSFNCSCSSSSGCSTRPAHSVASPDYHHGRDMLTFLDSRLPHGKQQDLLCMFVYEIAPRWPIVALPSEDLEQARRESPVLLLAVLAYTVTQHEQGTQQDTHDELVRETMRLLGDEVIVRGQQTLELVQALLVAGFWNKSARGESHASAFQLFQMAADMAVDLGIAGPALQPSPAAYFRRLQDPASLDARRTWLACFLAMSAASMSTRRPIAMPWNTYHDECLLYLETADGGPSDILLCQIVRISVLIQEAAAELHLCDLTTFLDGNHYTTHAIIDSLKTRAHASAAQVPPGLAAQQPVLQIMWHVAIIYIHEPVLWTRTNMSSFTSPFIPGRIAVHDFARPPSSPDGSSHHHDNINNTTIIPPLQAALASLIQHCHAVVDIATSSNADNNNLTPSAIVHLPSSSTAPLITYALYMLVNVLVAGTGVGSTYARLLPRTCFQIDEYAAKLRALNRQLLRADPTMSCWTTRILDATSWLEQWYTDYAGIVRRYEASLVIA